MKTKTAEQIMKKDQVVRGELDRYLPKDQADELWDKAEKKLASIMAQYPDLPEGVRSHTENIFPAAAVYLCAKEELGEETAYRIIEDAAIKVSSDANRTLSKIMKIPGMPGLFLSIWEPVTKKKFGPSSGFENVFYAKVNKEYRMDVTACPYVRYFTELGCFELAKIFCANDDRVYGNLPGLEFRRKGTLGRGDDRCDFYIRRK